MPEKRAQRLTFWVRRPPGGVGAFHAKGWWPKTSCPPSKLCFPWVSKRGIRDVPGILPGCPGPLAVFKKFVQKNFVCIFRSLKKQQINPPRDSANSGSPMRHPPPPLTGATGPALRHSKVCIRRDYHKSFVQPDFRTEKKGPSLEVFCIFPTFKAEKAPKKSAPNPGYQ